jgi:hypothetical protein
MGHPYDEVFRSCDFHHVKNELISTFAGGVIPKAFASLLDAFVRQPCPETAIPLIQYNPELAIVFHDSGRSKQPMENLRDTTRPRLTPRILTQEPEFNDYCDSIHQDINKHKELKQQLLGKGYTEEQLSEAFANYWRDLASGI